jgi:hypothetical protein
MPSANRQLVSEVLVLAARPAATMSAAALSSLRANWVMPSAT